MTPTFPLASIEIANARLWTQEIAAFQNQSLPQNPVCFTGSSSIALWSTLAEDFPDVPVVNRGFGGSQLSDSVYHFESLVLPVAPRAIAFYAGDNDLAFGKTPERLAENFQALAQKIQFHLPQTPFYFLSIKSSPARWNLISQIRRANALIREACDALANFHFVDIEHCLLGDDGRPDPKYFLEDELHLSPAGYEVWAGVLQSLLEPFKDRA